MEELKAILEILYLLSAPVLVVIAYIALGQIKIAKSQVEEQRNAIKISAKRDSLKTMSEQIAKYGEEIIPIINTLDQKIKSENIVFFEESELEITNTAIKVKPYSNNNEFEKLSKIMLEFINTMNALEGFSAFFVTGVADEKVAYRSLSSTFCGSVRKILPLVVLLSNGDNRFAATMQLFQIWNSRLEAESLENQKNELEKKNKSNKVQYIETIGNNA